MSKRLTLQRLHVFFAAVAAIEEQLNESLRVVTPEVRGRISTKKSGITIREVIVLDYISRHPECSVPNVKENAFSKKNPNPVINGLKREGLIVDSSEKNKSAKLKITDKGQNILTIAHHLLCEGNALPFPSQ